MEEYDRNICCCFTGHQLESLPPIGSEAYEKLLTALHEAVLRAYHNGYRVFYSGICNGFDLLAGEEIIAQQEVIPAFKLLGALPYDGFSTGPLAVQASLANSILECCDSTTVISTRADRRCYQKRNMYMVDHSSLVIAAYFGGTGGTLNTIRYAERCGVPVWNIAEGIPWDKPQKKRIQ